MASRDSAAVFDDGRTSLYQQQRAGLAPVMSALHDLTGVVLSALPAEARVLCVGVGTGDELLAFARTFPRWRFTAVEPAAPMMQRCRERVEEAGIASRCTFHQGYLRSLPDAPPFDAATALLVSHFLVESEARTTFFHEIAVRLRPDGLVVNADLAGSASAHAELRELWIRMLRGSGLPTAQLEKMITAIDGDIAVLPPVEVASLIAAGGFQTPVPFLQSLLLHAWYARRGR